MPTTQNDLKYINRLILQQVPPRSLQNPNPIQSTTTSTTHVQDKRNHSKFCFALGCSDMSASSRLLRGKERGGELKQVQGR